MSLGTLVKAADVPAKKVDAPIDFAYGYTYNWTGFYFGANAGYSWATINPKVSGPGLTGGTSETLSSLNGGAQVGYNWQINSFVFGIESDFQSANLRGSALFGGINETDNLRWFGTARARIGYVTPIHQLLLYGTGGASYGQVGTTLLGATNASLTRTRAGWTVGAA